MDPQEFKQHEEAAKQLGREHAENAASWTCDGNTEREDLRRRLEMLENGDPAIEQHLPARPDLSGEWADEPTPRSLASELGLEDCDSDDLDALSIAYESGVDDRFEEACEEELRKAYGTGPVTAGEQPEQLSSEQLDQWLRSKASELGTIDKP